MSESSLWSRLRKARLIRVLIVYLGASWAVIQVTNELTEALQLPLWVSPVAVILLVVGLLIIVATAWVQSGLAGAASDRAAPADAAAEDVPSAWDVGLSELKNSIVRGELPHLTWARALLGGVIAFSLLFGLAGLYVIIQDRGETFAPPEAVAAEAGPGVAVLPFQVRGGDLEAWREGMVDLLSTNIDGAADLRAIDSRTVMARWREAASEDAAPDLVTSLAVARAAQARYALLGSAVAIGPAVRLTADVYELAGGTKLGQARVEGSPDSVLTLVDELTIDVLRVILPERGPEISARTLASVTTTSLPALRTYLEGEAHYRRSNFDAAIGAYEAAIAEDSTFALALFRLAQSYGWARAVQAEATGLYHRRALEEIDRLPEREALIVRGTAALAEGRLEAQELLERAVRRYPDDPEAWFQLGDFYWHMGEQAVEAYAQGARAFERSIELDPTFSPAYIHLVEDAIFRDDSARAAQLIESYGRLAGGSDNDIVNRRLFALAFGDSIARAEAMAAALEPTDGISFRYPISLGNPRLWDVRRELLEGLRSWPERPRWADNWRYADRRLRGQLRAAAEEADQGDPVLRAISAYVLLDAGLELPAARLSRDLPLDVAVEGWGGPARAFFVGAHAADEGRWSDHAAVLERLDRQVSEARARGDSELVRVAGGVSAGLRGYAAWRRGRSVEALEGLESAVRRVSGHTWEWSVNWQMRRWIARLLVEQGRYQEAERYYLSVAQNNDPYASYELGKLYMQLGEEEKAREHLTFVVQAWRDADPELTPKVDEARRILEGIASE